MDIDLKFRPLRTSTPIHQGHAKPGGTRDHRSARLIKEERAAPPTPQMVRDVSRAAWHFQRSAMGHLDHQGWYERMQRDGQQLIDLLTDMGFTPAPRPGRGHGRGPHGTKG